jgi:hypothetical protein
MDKANRDKINSERSQKPRSSPLTKDTHGQQPSGAKQDSNNTKSKLRNGFNSFRKKWVQVAVHEKINVLLTLAIACSTTIYTCVPAKTLKEIRSSSSDTHDLAVAAKNQADEMIQQNRAFVSFAQANLGAKVYGAEGTWGKEISIKWNNSGNTPAKNVVVQIGGRTQADFPVDFPLIPRTKTRTVISPKGDAAGFPVIISKEEIVETWRLGTKMKLFIWGDAVYKDTFPSDPDRLTEFCVQIKEITLNYKVSSILPQSPSLWDDPRADVASFDVLSCPSHNCYDGDCSDYAERVQDML